MKITYMNDAERGAGHGILQLTELPDLQADDSLTFSILRGSDRNYLGQGGWQQADAYLAPDFATQHSDGGNLLIGPAIVDKLDQDETYRITVRSNTLEPVRATLVASGIVYSPSTGNNAIGAVAAPVQPAAPATPVPIKVEEEIAPPEPVQQEPTLEQSLEISPPQQASSGSSKMVIILVLLAILAAAGAGIWYFLLRDEGDTTPPPAKEFTLKEQAHQQLSGEAKPEESFAMAQRFRTMENGADPAFLLAEDAAEKGNADAMLMTGDFYDPSSTESHGSIVKDFDMAMSWYTKAKQAGNAKADEYSKRLTDWKEKGTL